MRERCLYNAAKDADNFNVRKYGLHSKEALESVKIMYRVTIHLRHQSGMRSLISRRIITSCDTSDDNVIPQMRLFASYEFHELDISKLINNGLTHYVQMCHKTLNYKHFFPNCNFAQLAGEDFETNRAR